MNDVRKHYAAISICCAVLCFCVVAAVRAQQANDAAAPPKTDAVTQGGDLKSSDAVISGRGPVGVGDSHGRGGGDLPQKDFELSDQDKPRPIAGFSIQKRAAGAESAASAGNSVGAGALNGAAAGSA